MDDDLFDEDELINDYANNTEPDECDEYPPPYDNHDDDDDNRAATTGCTVEEATTIPIGIPSPESSPESTVQQLEEIIKRKRPTKDLFAFERFTDDSDWRSTSINDNNNNMTERSPAIKKSRSTSMSPSPYKTKQPEACLFHNTLLQGNSYMTNTLRTNRLSRSPVTGSTNYTITLRDESRRYVAVRAEASQKTATTTTHYLLGVPFETVLNNVHEARRQRFLRRRPESSLLPDDTTATSSHSEESLWVDKHSPLMFTHLLSDERMNRTVLKTLKQWDDYIFGKAKRPPPIPQRVLLLSGQPGTGKSTLARVVAQHCHYNIIEVNGSDERSEKTLKDRVLSAMESNSISFDRKIKSRPNLLVLDEIDGADAAKSIKALVDIIQSDVLKRPIIFICNNKYVPSLKPLLGIAQSFHLHPPSNERLLLRLRTVLKTEGYFVPTNLLNQLIGVAAGDIRSCLHTLQFASASGQENISRALENLLNGNTKDERNDLVNTISAVFRKPKALRFGGTDNAVGKVLEFVHGFGDDSRIMDCLFLNVLQVPYIDPMLDRCDAAHDWISSSDISRNQHSTAHVSAAIHLLCRVENRQELTFSTRSLADVQYKTETNRAMIHKFAEGVSLHAHCPSYELATVTIPYLLWILSAGAGSGALDRSVATPELLSDREKYAFERHAATLRTMGLEYVVDEGFGRPEASYLPQNVRLEPPIERLALFDGLVNQRKEIPVAVKEILSTKASHDRLRDTVARITGQAIQVLPMEKSTDATKTNEESLKHAKRTTTSTSKRPEKRIKPQNFLAMGAKRAKEARTSRTAARVGFQPSNNTTKLSKTGSGRPLSQVVRLKYIKGFTQAVRTPFRLEDL